MAAKIESILDKARKVLALAQRGEAGEALAAKAALNALLRKHGLTIDDLRQTRRKERRFSARGKDERTLFAHCLLKMFGQNSEVTQSAYSNLREQAIYAEMSEVEYLDFAPFFAFHLRQYRIERKKQLNTVKVAYVHKHRLFADDRPTASENKSDIDWGALRRIMAMAQTMDDVSYYKSISNE